MIFVTTHDSIGLGEDGPTHQPIEHLASLRAMPNILMMRPGDGNETAGAYKVGLGHTTPLQPEAFHVTRCPPSSDIDIQCLIFLVTQVSLRDQNLLSLWL